MKVVGISGAQGAGKSTLLAALAANGWMVDSFRVARAVQAQLGWDSLDCVMESAQNMMDFQNEVFIQKHMHDIRLMERHAAGTVAPRENIILVERTFADIAAYAAHWTWQNVHIGRISEEEAVSFLRPFSEQCFDSQEKIYTGTVLLPYMEHIAWEEDTHRAARADVDSIFSNVEQFISMTSCCSLKICSKTVADRVVEVQTFLETL